MTYIRNTTIAVLTALITTSAMAEAITPLNKEKHINSSLVSVAIGNYIRKSCPTISGRRILAIRKGFALKDYALDKGYTEPEIRKFLKDPTEKKRIKGIAWSYLTKRGVVIGDTESFCQAGRAEIAKKTLTGTLLRSR